MKRYFLIVFVVSTAMFSGCSKYAHVSLNYPLEPIVYLPDEINEIAVVNRSLTSEEAKDSKVMEAIVSSEIAGSDRLASDEAIKGVYARAQDWAGTIVVIPEKARLEGTGTREVPELLDWDLVEEICKRENADALLVLETFDSNTDLFKQAAVTQVASILSSGKPAKAVPGQVKMNVVCFWRMYEPSSRTIIDQYQDNRTMSFNLVRGLPPADALPDAAYSTGVSYISRFMPSYYTVRRDLYKKTKGPKKQQFKSGYRRAEVANWEDAIEVWIALVDEADFKTAGRSCLNVAVAHEVLGNTEEALKWAQRAYEDYGDKQGRDYAKVLLRRKKIEGR